MGHVLMNCSDFGSMTWSSSLDCLSIFCRALEDCSMVFRESVFWLAIKSADPTPLRRFIHLPPPLLQTLAHINPPH